MRTIEKILLILCFIGIGMDLFNLEGGIAIMLLGFLLLTIFYLGFTWLLIRDTGSKKYHLAVSVPLSVVLALSCIGAAYKLLLWPGREGMLMISLVGIVPLLVVLLVIYRKKKDNESSAQAYRKALQRLIPFFFFASALAFVPDSTIIHFKYRKDPGLARLLVRAVEHPENEQYWRDLEDYQLNKYFRPDTLNR